MKLRQTWPTPAVTRQEWLAASRRLTVFFLTLGLLVALAHDVRAQNACCVALANAEKTADQAMRQPPAPGNLGGWKGQFAAQLDQIRRQLCLNRDAQKQLDALIQSVNKVTYLDGNNPQYVPLLKRQLKFSGILVDLGKLKAASGCGGAPSAAGSRPTEVSKSSGRVSTSAGICKAGEQSKAPGDDEAADFMLKGIKDAIKELEDKARELEGPGRPISHQLDDIKGRIAKLKQAKGYWDQIKAASCLPPDVLSTMRAVAADIRASGHSGYCPQMCDALGKWFEKLVGREKSLERKLFMEDCMGRCPS